MDETSVSRAVWVREVGRPDLIDDVADRLGRPVATGMTAFWPSGRGLRWPRTRRAWRSYEREAH